MKLLLDTQVLIWASHAPERLRPRVREALDDQPSGVSLVSLWEISIKRSVGKLELRDDFLPWLEGTTLERLPIEFAHVWAVGDLPYHHGDPFDRLLVAQALVENLTLVTSDRTLAVYGVDILAA